MVHTSNTLRSFPLTGVDLGERGRMFSIEGLDGAGKTTQAKAVTDALLELGYDAKWVTNPSPSELGVFLRSNLQHLPDWQRVSLFAIDMIDVLRSLEDPKQIIVWDRYTHSSLVSNRNVTPESITEFFAGFPKPVMTFMLDILPEEIIKGRSQSLHDHSLDLDLQRLKHKRYMELIEAEPEQFQIINAQLTQEEITRIMLARICESLNSDIEI